MIPKAFLLCRQGRNQGWCRKIGNFHLRESLIELSHCLRIGPVTHNRSRVFLSILDLFAGSTEMRMCIAAAQNPVWRKIW
jgi:hypothetical protein